MIILDAHQDIAYNTLQYGREYPSGVAAIRHADARAGTPLRAANGLPEALAGRVAIIFATLFVEPDWSTFTPHKRCGYSSAAEAQRQALRQWDVYQRLAEQEPRLRLIDDQAGLDAVLATWEPVAQPTAQPDAAPDGPQIGLVLLMEGADPILEPAAVEEWVARGVRIIGPAWSETRYAGGTGRPGPLTDLGRELLDAMADHGLILDLSHLTIQGYMEAIERYPGPVIASHSNPTASWDDHRNLTDDQIAALAEREGVIGVVLYNRFLTKEWYHGARKREYPLDLVTQAIDHICQVTGSAAYVGIGSDIDGGFGVEDMPAGIDTVADLPKIGDALAQRGFSPADVEAVLSGNFLRVLRRGLP